jgi:hypothetical protein
MIYLGKLLTNRDLKIFFFDIDGVTPVDPYYVSYTMFDLTHNKKEIISQTINNKPMKFDHGSYFAPIDLDPKVFRPGRHLIQWSFKRFSYNNIELMNATFDITRPTYWAGEFCKMPYAVDRTVS